MTTNFAQHFARFASVAAPRPWQAALAADTACVDRRIRIPTGFGKTLGVLGAWSFHRLERGDPSWPRRLVWALPMRVLVEQTVHEAREALKRLGRLQPDGEPTRPGAVCVHALMGGVEPGEWHLHPEREAVLIGTQDMLLSRAMNRGYGSARGRWPMEFGLLNQDCLWVMDEIQLMDVGLATSAQLQAFRQQDEPRSLRPCRTWWMSATLQPGWLSTPDTQDLLARVKDLPITDSDRAKNPLWDGVTKTLVRQEALDPVAWATRAAELHLALPAEPGRLTLLVTNTVDRAVALHAALSRLRTPGLVRKPGKGRKGAPTPAGAEPPLARVELELVHSRFRPHERKRWRERFLNRGACAGADRIIVSTQVVEAGVDISADLLMTELAPWPSLVQRFGRVARYGGAGVVHVVPVDAPAPYDGDELSAAWDALARLDDVGPAGLEAFERANPGAVPGLYPYDPKHLLLRSELDELFDTTPDLTGADIDVSRFIRTGEERDLQVAWWAIPARSEPLQRRPARDELCPVPVGKAQEWLCGKTSRLQPGLRAWVWDFLEGGWRRLERADLFPGQVVLVSAECGGYSSEQGFEPGASPVEVVPPTAPSVLVEAQDAADARQDGEDLSAFRWKTIATHGHEVGVVARRLAEALELPPGLARVLELAGRWHDLGKAHVAFQRSIEGKDRPRRQDLAKAPGEAWLSPRHMYDVAEEGEPRRRRRGFRHELASALALFDVLRRHAPEHPALLGPWREVLAACGLEVDPATTPVEPPCAVEREVLALDAASFDLLAYLVASHHGKVRARLHAAPGDQDYRPSRSETARLGGRSDLPIRGVLETDRLPATLLSDAEGTPHRLPELRLTLAPASAGLSRATGASWLDRVQGLLRVHGPFALAWLEALLRAADVEASVLDTPDPLLQLGVTA